MSNHQTLEEALVRNLPAELQDDAIKLAQIINAVINTPSISPSTKEYSSEELSFLEGLRVLAGKKVATEESLISFGANSQFGEIAIHDIAKNNIINININLSRDTITNSATNNSDVTGEYTVGASVMYQGRIEDALEPTFLPLNSLRLAFISVFAALCILAFFVLYSEYLNNKDSYLFTDTKAETSKTSMDYAIDVSCDDKNICALTYELAVTAANIIDEKTVLEMFISEQVRKARAEYGSEIIPYENPSPIYIEGPNFVSSNGDQATYRAKILSYFHIPDLHR